MTRREDLTALAIKLNAAVNEDSDIQIMDVMADIGILQTQLLTEVVAVLSEDWPKGRIMPRMVGAEDMARIEEIRKILDAPTARLGRPVQ